MQPRESAFHDPAGRAQTAAMRRSTLGEVGRDAASPQRVTMRVGIVAAITLHPIRPETRVTHPAGNRRDPLHQHQQLSHIVAMCSRKNRRQWQALRVGDEVVLRPGLAPVRGIGARLRPPKTARTEDESTTARDQSIRSAACNRANNVRWILSQTPAFCQSRNRRQHVIPDPHPISGGRSSHGMPVLSTNRIPVSTARSSSRFRPGYRNRRRLTGKSGPITSHNSSSNTVLAMKVPPSHGPKITNQQHVEHSFC
jgi:hypothetical protein